MSGKNPEGNNVTKLTLYLLIAIAICVVTVNTEKAEAQSTSTPGTPAQTLSGTVVDEQTSRPLSGATLTIPTLHRTTTTDSKGAFSFANLPAGQHIIQVRTLGYAPDSTVVQFGASSQNITIRVKRTALELSALTVSTEREAPIGKSFQPTSVLQGESLDKQVSSSIAATLTSQPGVTQKYNGPTAAQPVIRGLTGDRVLVLEDGLRTGDIATTGSDHAITIDPLTANRIEVIRGPAGLMYGTNTLGGVVNVIRDYVPHMRPERRAITHGLHFESMNRSATILGAATLPLPYRFTAKAEITGRKGGDSRTPSGKFPFTDLRTLDAAGGLSWIGPASLIGISFREYQSKYGVPSSYGGIMLPGSHEEGVYIDLRRSAARLEGEYRPQGSFLKSVNMLTNYVHFNQQELEDDGHVETQFRQKFASGDIVARYGSGRHKGAFGAFTQWRDFRTSEGLTGSRSATQKSLAGFAFHEVDLSPLHLMAGLRYDRLHFNPLDSTTSPLLTNVRSRTFGSLTWTGGATYSVTRDVVIGANVARSSRAPAIEELYSAGPHMASYAFEIGDPNLKTESGLGADLFLRYTHSRAVAEISIFDNNIKGFIQHAPVIDSVTGLPVLDPEENRYVVYQAKQGNARLSGIEGSFQFEVRPGLAFDATASTLRGTGKNGVPLPAMPPARINLGLQHNGSVWFAGGNIETMFAQKRVPDAPNEGSYCSLSAAIDVDSLRPAEFCPTPGTVLFNTVGGLRFTMNNVLHTVTLSIDNIFNREWHDPLWRAKQVAPQPGRNIKLLYRVRY